MTPPGGARRSSARSARPRSSGEPSRGYASCAPPATGCSTRSRPSPRWSSPRRAPSRGWPGAMRPRCCSTPACCCRGPTCAPARSACGAGWPWRRWCVRPVPTGGCWWWATPPRRPCRRWCVPTPRASPVASSPSGSPPGCPRRCGSRPWRGRRTRFARWSERQTWPDPVDVLGPVPLGPDRARLVVRVPRAQGAELTRALAAAQAARSARKESAVRVQVDPVVLG